MAELTVSVVKGEGCLRHNNREYDEGKYPDHIDRDRSHLNYTIKKQSLEEAYEYLFGEAVKKYDENQSRPDRRYGSTKAYLEKMERSKQQEPFYEVILQYGDMFSHGILPREDGQGINIEAEQARDMLIDAFQRFEAKYPNLYFFNVTLHMDEATPHIHADYIPYAEGYKKGLERRVAMDKSLQQMGYKPSNTNKTALEAWQKDTRQTMASVAIERGYKVIETRGKTLHRSVEAYKRDVAELDRKIERQKVPEPVRTPVPLVKDKVLVSTEELDKLVEVAQMKLEQRDLMEKAIDHAERLTSECEAYMERVRPLDRILKRAKVIVNGDLVTSLKKKVADLEERLVGYISPTAHEAALRKAKEEAKKGMVNKAVYDSMLEPEFKKARDKGYNEGFDDVKNWLASTFGHVRELRQAFKDEFREDLVPPPPPTHYR